MVEEISHSKSLIYYRLVFPQVLALYTTIGALIVGKNWAYVLLLLYKNDVCSCCHCLRGGSRGVSEVSRNWSIYDSLRDYLFWDGA